MRLSQLTELMSKMSLPMACCDNIIFMMPKYVVIVMGTPCSFKRKNGTMSMMNGIRKESTGEKRLYML